MLETTLAASSVSRPPGPSATTEAARAGPRGGVAGKRPRRVDRAERAQHVGCAERIVEEAAAVEDARDARAGAQVLGEHLAPQPLDRGHLREEAVPADVEAVSAEG